MPKTPCCNICKMPDGECAFPWYGDAPGTRDATMQKLRPGTSELFAPDPESPGLGTHWCPCGHGKPKADLRLVQ